MAIPVLTREYNRGACRSSRKLMRLPLHSEMRPESPALHAEVFRVLNQTCKEPRFPWWTPENPQEHCHKTRRTLMSPPDCKIDFCTPNQLKMKRISPAFTPYPSRFSHHILQVALHPFGKSRDFLRRRSQVSRNINFSKAPGGKLPAPPTFWRWELIPYIRLKR